jgi:putative hydrolase of the HAD superfamily
MPVQQIIFDLGNVLFDLDLGKTGRILHALTGDQYAAAHAQLLRDRVFESYEVGGMTTAEFLDAVRLATDPPLSASEVEAAWNSIFVDFPRARLDMLLRLRQKYKVFLLSNINDLHATWIDDYMLREHQVPDFQHRYFDGVYYSHLIRLRKPNREIYEYVLADAELIPEETVFFDDLEPNVLAAQSLGIQAFVHPIGMEIEEHLKQRGLY